jgi:hypothetical protein
MGIVQMGRRLLLVSVAAGVLAGCGGGADDIASPGEGTLVGVTPAPTPTPTPPPVQTGPAADCPTGTTNVGVVANRRNCRLPARIATSLSLARVNGLFYSIDGRVDVGTDVGGDGTAAGGQRATLAIDPGVVVVGQSAASFLVVNRGSQINAVGTASAPIIFTSLANLEGTATDSSESQWGGVILLGQAPISDCNASVPGGSAQCQQQVEGTQAAAFYGGANPNDNSGQLRFVQIRFTGFSLIANSELQGLTTGGVGAGTIIENVQVHNSGDDGIEIFGGRHNARRLVITGAGDDTLDTDFGYKGGIQYLIGVQRPLNISPSSPDKMIEADTPAATGGSDDTLPRQNTLLSNFTFVQTATGRAAIHLRGGTDFTLANGVVVSPGYCLDVDGAATVQAANAQLDKVGPPVIRSTAFSCALGFPDTTSADTDTFEDQVQTANNGNGNNFGLTSTLANIFVNGANETAVTPFNATLLNSTFGANGTVAGFFQQTSYIGAVRDANDTWYRGWTCDSGYVSFGSNQNCNVVPA